MTSRFLVVDDAGFIRDLIKKQLRGGFPGCRIVDVPDALRAQSALRREQFDLILCDWEMPGMTGEELLRWVRSQPALKEVPFIMVTSRGDREFVVRAVQAGVNDYLGKPFSAETLLAKVRRQLSREGEGPRTPTARSPVPEGVAADSVALLTGKQLRETVPAPSTVRRGQARLNFSSGPALACAIRKLSLQELAGVMPRTESPPALFSPVVVSIVEAEGQRLARINGYVHAIAAAERRQDASSLTIIIRFVDDDPAKLETLSRWIATLSP